MVSNRRLNPQLFALYLAIGSIVMMFAALSSAYIVRQAAGNWLEFKLPDPFFYSAGVAVLSSLFLHLSWKSFNSFKFRSYRLYLILTLLLGLSFVVIQYLGWKELEGIGVYLTGNPSGSFVYALTALHVLHVLGGIAALTVALIFAFQLPDKVSEKRLNRFRMTIHYWHFVGGLWIYLLMFLILQK